MILLDNFIKFPSNGPYDTFSFLQIWLQAEINCMQDSLAEGQSWKYYINLVGEVFPLKTNLEMVKILKIYKGANDIEGLPEHRYR